MRVNSNQNQDVTVLGIGNVAFWNTAFGAKQGAAVTIANTTLSGDALILAATGTLSGNAYPDFIRVAVSTTSATVATTTNAGVSATTVGTFTPAGGFANGDIITAVVDGTNAVAAPTVYVWRTRAGVDLFLGAAQITPNPLWQNGGRIGLTGVPNNGRVDDFAGGNAP